MAAKRKESAAIGVRTEALGEARAAESEPTRIVESCPVCRRRVVVDLALPREKRPFAPFCSQRCREVDLGLFATEAYRISRPLRPDELMEGEMLEGGDLLADGEA